MRDYEVTVIVQPQLEDEARNELIARVSDWLVPGADEDSKPVENHWGSRLKCPWKAVLLSWGRR